MDEPRPAGTIKWCAGTDAVKTRDQRSTSPDAAERPEVDVEVLVGEPEGRFQLVHPLAELEQRQPEALDLLRGEATPVHAPDGLVLEHAAQELDQRQDRSEEHTS